MHGKYILKDDSNQVGSSCLIHKWAMASERNSNIMVIFYSEFSWWKRRIRQKWKYILLSQIDSPVMIFE